MPGKPFFRRNTLCIARENGAAQREKARRWACEQFSVTPYNYRSQLPTVRGKGSTSRMFEMPVRYMTQRSKPRPKPAWRVEPYLRRSR